MTISSPLKCLVRRLERFVRVIGTASGHLLVDLEFETNKFLLTGWSVLDIRAKLGYAVNAW